MLCQVLRRHAGDAVTKAQIVLHLLPPQVEKPVTQAQLIAHSLAFFRRKRQPRALAEHFKAVGQQLDAPGFDFFIDRVLAALAHDAGHGDDGLVAQALGRGKVACRQNACVKDHLQHALAVAQVGKDDAPHVAPRADPAAGCHSAADV